MLADVQARDEPGAGAFDEQLILLDEQSHGINAAPLDLGHDVAGVMLDPSDAALVEVDVPALAALPRNGLPELIENLHGSANGRDRQRIPGEVRGMLPERFPSCDATERISAEGVSP